MRMGNERRQGSQDEGEEEDNEMKENGGETKKDKRQCLSDDDCVDGFIPL